MTGYLCNRCGTMWGWPTKPRDAEREAEFKACVGGTCFPVREVLNSHAVALRERFPGMTDVIRALELREERWKRQYASWAAAMTIAEPPPPEAVVAVAVGMGTGTALWPKDNEAIKTLCDIWIARWGPGSAPGDVIRNAAKHLKREGAPYDAVVRSFQRYVDTVEDAYASPYAWRKRWRSFDPEEPEFDHEAAKVADSMDRTMRKMTRRGGGMQSVGQTLKRLPEGGRR